MTDIELGKEDILVRVGIAEGAVVQRTQRIRTTGLGSCVGLILYDVIAGVAGLVHIMLPAAPNSDGVVVPKYADIAVPWIMEQVCRCGAKPARIKAKLAGGAQMFAFAGKSDIMRVGPRNVEAVMDGLQKLSIPVVASDVGGNVGRTIEFDVQTETLFVRTALKGEYTI